jgi:Flp pilus assembly protein TadG
MTRPLVKRTERWPFVWAAIVTVLLVALAGTFIAYLRASSVARCTNDALRGRNDLTAQDHVNEARKIAGQKVAVTHQALGLKLALTDNAADQRRGVLLYQRGVTEFKQSLTDWQTRDNRVNAERAAHPLGRC